MQTNKLENYGRATSSEYDYAMLGCYHGHQGAVMMPARGGGLDMPIPIMPSGGALGLDDLSNRPQAPLAVPAGHHLIPTFGASLTHSSLNKGNVPTYRSYYNINHAYGQGHSVCTPSHTLRVCGGCSSHQ